MSVLFRGLGEIFGFLVVVINHAAIGQCQVGEEVMRADHTPYREVGHRRIDVRNEMQPAGTEPGALDVNIDQIDRDQLAHLGATIDAGYQLQIDLGFRQRRMCASPLPAMASCL